MPAYAAPVSDSSVVRVAIVNDYEIVVAGIASVLAEHADRVAVVELDARVPVVSDVDVVLYDTYGQVQGSGIDMSALVGPGQAKVVVFSWNVSSELVQQSLDAGAAGYVSKGVSSEELVDVVERVHAGECVLPDVSVTAPSGDAIGRWPGRDEGLSARESEVLALICQGFSNEEIGGRAFIGINTVKTHVKSIYQKIGVDSRTKALLWGVDHGFRPDTVRYLPSSPS